MALSIIAPASHWKYHVVESQACLWVMLCDSEPLFLSVGYVTLIVVIGFLTHPIHHVDPAWFAIIGATILCVTTGPLEVEKVMHVSVGSHSSDFGGGHSRDLGGGHSSVLGNGFGHGV